ncbi:hypothetical protein PYCCODRAFT_668112 [Trametes coccinea BRFM310]|uniref:Uncharacterized protein n=1 Tax=Trametes coccinea (strain BRFM310) TaxID=1353009 RepID=A0A1Y2IHH3_TRAC3|nr:hypothetical protein PYCCODRAFT_668112 [Trametes coccinea BRFM310]
MSPLSASSPSYATTHSSRDMFLTVFACVLAVMVCELCIPSPAFSIRTSGPTLPTETVRSWNYSS